MNTENIPSVFESASVARLRAGDVLLFRCPQKLSKEQRARCADVVNEVFGDFEVLILDGGQDIAVLRPELGFVARLMRRMLGKAPA